MRKEVSNAMQLKWKALYHDGISLSQFNEDGSENRYHDIDRNRLSHFVLFNENGKAVFSVVLHPDQKLIYRRRTVIRGDGQVSGSVYLVGWQQKIRGKSVKSIAYVYEDGAIELDDDRNDLELLPQEN